MQGDNVVEVQEGSKVESIVVPIKKTSGRQIDANRRNAQKSTGAKTSEGKERSSMNALKHGAFQKVFPSSLANQEDFNLFESIHLGLIDAWIPQGAQEENCVCMITVAYFKLFRLDRYEFDLIQMEIEKLLPSDGGELAAYLEKAEETVEILRNFDEDPLSAIESLADWDGLVNEEKIMILQKVSKNLENPESNIYENQEVLRAGVFKLADQIGKEAEKKRGDHEKLKRMAFVNAFPSEEVIAKLSKYGGPIQKTITQNIKLLVTLQGIRKKRSGEK